MRIGIPKETHAGETRVAATPETVRKLVAQGHQVTVEQTAGRAACITDGDEIDIYPPMQRDIEVTGYIRLGGREHQIDTMDIYS